MAPNILPRDIDLSEETLRRAFTPHPYEQRLTLYFLAGTMALVAFIWLLPRIKINRFTMAIYVLLRPFELLDTIVHELSHAIGIMISGRFPASMVVNLDTSGATGFYGVNNGLRSFATITPSGYLGSGLYFAALTFAGFSIFAVGTSLL